MSSRNRYTHLVQFTEETLFGNLAQFSFGYRYLLKNARGSVFAFRNPVLRRGIVFPVTLVDIQAPIHERRVFTPENLFPFRDWNSRRKHVLSSDSKEGQ